MASTEPSVLPPSQEEVRNAFKTAILTLKTQPTLVLDWFDDTLTVFEAMVTTLEDTQTPGLSAQSPLAPFLGNLRKWSEASLQPALEVLRETRDISVLSVNPFCEERFATLETRYKSLYTTLELYISPSAQGSQMQPLVQHFLDTLFHNSTLDCSEIKQTWIGFLRRIDPDCEDRTEPYTILPNCFVICHCSPPERLRHRQVVGTSAETWFRVKVQREAKGEIRALGRMIKDVRFHWLVEAYCQQNSTASKDQARDRINEIRNQGTKIKDQLLGNFTFQNSATKLSEEKSVKLPICSPFPKHRAWIVDVKSGKPKARCGKCRALFIREFAQEQLKLEREEPERKAFSGLGCAEDIGVVLCRD